jgi:hypothetical protein
LRNQVNFAVSGECIKGAGEQAPLGRSPAAAYVGLVFFAKRTRWFALTLQTLLKERHEARRSDWSSRRLAHWPGPAAQLRRVPWREFMQAAGAQSYPSRFRWSEFRNPVGDTQTPRLPQNNVDVQRV